MEWYWILCICVASVVVWIALSALLYKPIFKRFYDILFSLIALVPILFVILIFGPIIYFTDKGPIFHCGERTGKKGKKFKMVKFRSMKVNAPDIRNTDGSTFNGANDPRVTKIGKFMRKTSIDELPQFFNVLVGHMSLIGPRAHMAKNFVSYEALDENRQKRLNVKPGITGYNQAYFRNSVSAEQKILNDVYYAEHVSFFFDIKIIFKTVFSVLKRENIYVSQEKKENVNETK